MAAKYIFKLPAPRIHCSLFINKHFQPWKCLLGTGTALARSGVFILFVLFRYSIGTSCFLARGKTAYSVCRAKSKKNLKTLEKKKKPATQGKENVFHA